MSESDAGEPMDRRAFLRTAATGAAGTGAVAVGMAAGQETGSGGEGTASGGGGTETVAVGAGSNGTSFDPAELTVAPGTTVVWEWTGEGGAHNVVSEEEGPLDSGNAEEGSDITYEYTFEETGEFPYYCAPHQSVGMEGTVVVQEGGGGGGGESEPPIPNQAVTLGVVATSTMVSTLGLAYVFIKYGGDYGDG